MLTAFCNNYLPDISFFGNWRREKHFLNRTFMILPQKLIEIKHLPLPLNIPQSLCYL